MNWKTPHLSAWKGKVIHAVVLIGRQVLLHVSTGEKTLEHWSVYLFTTFSLLFAFFVPPLGRFQNSASSCFGCFMADTLPLSLNSTFVGLVVHSLHLLSMQTFSPSVLPHLTSSFAAVILTTATRGRCLILNVIICCHKCFVFISSEEMFDMFDTYLMIKCWVYEGLTSIKHGVNVIRICLID